MWLLALRKLPGAGEQQREGMKLQQQWEAPMDKGRESGTGRATGKSTKDRQSGHESSRCMLCTSKGSGRVSTLQKAKGQPQVCLQGEGAVGRRGQGTMMKK